VAGFDTMAERSARRDDVLTVVSDVLATDTAANWEARLKPLGIPVAAVRTWPRRSMPCRNSLSRPGSTAWSAAVSRWTATPDYRPARARRTRLSDHHAETDVSAWMASARRQNVDFGMVRSAQLLVCADRLVRARSRDRRMGAPHSGLFHPNVRFGVFQQS
jgi:hypothetical protein